MKTRPVSVGTSIIEVPCEPEPIEKLTLEQRIDRLERLLNIGVNSAAYVEFLKLLKE